MAQVRQQQLRHPSPTHTRVRPLPDPMQFQQPPSDELQRTQSLRNFERPSYLRTPVRSIHTQLIINPPAPVPPPRFGQIGFHHPSEHAKYDPLTGLMIDASTSATNSNANFDQSYLVSSSFNPRLFYEREQAPPVPPRATENHYVFPRHRSHFDQARLDQQLLEAEELLDMPALDDDDGLPVVSMESKNLPVFARFPFDVTFLPQPMEINVEDNIHRLRLRLIDSELNHQRRSTDEYIKRTQEQSLRPSSKPREQPMYHPRPPTNSGAYQRVTPKTYSRQAAYTPLSIGTPVIGAGFPRLSRGRIGMDYEPQINGNTERDVEIRPMHDTLFNDRPPNQPLVIANYSYDPRLNLQPMNVLERQYTSSNMDDLIDSMARRHLASRRFDTTSDRQRVGSRGYNPYHESAVVPRQASFQSQQRNDDLFFTNSIPSSQIEHNFLRIHSNDNNSILRSRPEHSHRLPTDYDHSNVEGVIRTNSYAKLPPIAPVQEPNRFDRSANPSTSALYRARQSPQHNRMQHPSVPLNLPDHAEHFIDLPSDIFLTSRTETFGSSQRRHHHAQKKPPPIRGDKSLRSTDSEQERSDEEKKASAVRRPPKPDKAEEQSAPNKGTNEFFTEEKTTDEPERKTSRRRTLFKKAALGIIFLRTLQHRAAKSRLNRPSQTSSATIHKIRLQEILVALHRVYLEPDGPICNALIQAITSPIELKDALNPSAGNHPQAIQLIGEALKNIISRIVDFMPKDGVLGSTKTSAIAALIQDGNPFPDNYFWQCEKQLLEFNRSKMINITKQRAVLLLIGIFIFRALVTTLLLKPIKYRLMLGELTPNQTANLKVLASVMFYVGRRTAGSNSEILTLPHEWQALVYNDTDIQPIVQHAEIKSITTKCELSLRIWCEEYIRRIDASLGKELRS